MIYIIVSLFATITPILNIKAAGGQSYFEKAASSFGGNATIKAGAGILLTENSQITPLYNGSYEGVRDVRELISGGFLTQQTQSHNISITYQLKPSLFSALGFAPSYTKELIIETKDESWGSGTFDNERTGGSIYYGWEGRLWIDSRLDLNIYQVKYPNYKSLASQGFGSELKTSTNVLDFNAIDLSFTTTRIFYKPGNSRLNLYLLISNRNFPDQKIIKKDGTLSDDLRKDTYLSLGAAFQRKIDKKKVQHFVSGAMAITALNSNQNSFDADNLKFIPEFYSYSEIKIYPTYGIIYKNFDIYGTLDFSLRNYKRFAQDEDGNYLDAKIIQGITTFRIDAYYRIPGVKNLTGMITGAVRSSSSNTKFEKVYRYNYSSENFLIGINYSFR